MTKKMTTEGTVNREQGLALYRTMLTIRLTEEQLLRAHQRGLIHGACHTYIGEEAVATGVCAHLRPQDPIFSTHRG
ncbi:MAG: thiamine pyrophosphate-dependent enzyme, partial [bacterium]